jgi:hypothetical protein
MAIPKPDDEMSPLGSTATQHTTLRVPPNFHMARNIGPQHVSRDFGPRSPLTAAQLKAAPLEGPCPMILTTAQLKARRTKPILARATLRESEVAAVLDAANTMAGAYDVAYGKAHAALFMHRRGYFGSTLPELLPRLVEQMRHAAAKWHGEEAAVALSLRCIELHTYQAGGGLLDVDHRDTGSAVSMSILLSDAAQMEGGRFITWGLKPGCVRCATAGSRAGHAAEAEVACATCPMSRQHEMAQGDALLFDSEKAHNVSTLTRGVRHSLVLELWSGPQNTHDRDR